MSNSLPNQILVELREQANADKSIVYAGFFKCGPGEYGEGDRFLGVTVPVQKQIAARYAKEASFADLGNLLDSEFHECRAVALQIIVTRYSTTKDSQEQAQLIDFYQTRFARINNWDLVDMSAPKLTGPWYLKRDRSPLYAWARSADLWTRRIAIMSSFAFIRALDFSTTFELADILLMDRHDLMQKATGWMLREIGNRDGQAERMWLAACPPAGSAESTLKPNQPRYRQMGRTMLRYAIEKFPKPEYQRWLKGTI
jgi:3-methyladenine DNA glycosylase AlkD